MQRFPGHLCNPLRLNLKILIFIKYPLSLLIKGILKFIFSLSIISDKLACQLTGTIFRMKNIIPSKNYRLFKSQKIHTITL